MSIYLILFLAGAVGMALMALLGLGRHSGHGHGHGGDAGHHHFDLGHHHGHAHGHHGGHHHGHGADGVDASAGVWHFPRFLFAISPLDIFAMMFAAGAAGMLLRGKVSAELLPWITLLCAIGFVALIVRPSFALAQKFASKPSEGLEGMVTKTATAISRFDAQGRGLVRIVFDDEEKQCLALLDPDDLSAGVQIGKGDQVVVLEVDPIKNSCRVSKV